MGLRVGTVVVIALLGGGGHPRIDVRLSPIGVGVNPFAAQGASLGRPVPPPAVAGNPALVVSVDLSDDTTLVSPLLDAINALRTEHRLAPLTTSAQLTHAAQAHVAALAYAGMFQHSWTNGQPFARWIARFYPIGSAAVWSVGENLLWSSGQNGELPADQALSLWVASPPHLHNLLTPSWQSIGIGAVAAQRAGGVYGGTDVIIVATDFGARTAR